MTREKVDFTAFDCAKSMNFFLFLIYGAFYFVAVVTCGWCMWRCCLQCCKQYWSALTKPSDPAMQKYYAQESKRAQEMKAKEEQYHREHMYTWESREFFKNQDDGWF